MSKNILIIVERSKNPVYLGSFPFLGPLYIVSFLEAKGISIDYLDKCVDYNKKIDYKRYDIVGFSVNVNNIENSLLTAKMIKSIKPSVDIVFGGPFASAYPQRLLRNDFIDAAIVGEGEETFYEYASGLERNRIKGLYYKESGRISITEPRGWIRDLDNLPFPALNKLNIKKYNVLYARRVPVSCIVTSRGCPCKCTFCFHSLGYEWRARSAKNVVDEIEWQVKTIGVREILIQDDNFSFDIRRAKEICDEIVRRKIRVSMQLGNGIRVDRIDRELLEKMYAAGVWTLCVSPETGSPDILKKLNKGFRLEDVERVFKMAKDIGMVREANFLVGFPWETYEDMKKTVDFSFKLNSDFSYLNKYISMPKTELYTPMDNTENEAILFDESYEANSGDSEDEIIKAFMRLYRKQYFRPRNIIKIIVLLRLYSFSKLFSPQMLRTIFKSSLAKLSIIFSQNKLKRRCLWK